MNLRKKRKKKYTLKAQVFKIGTRVSLQSIRIFLWASVHACQFGLKFEVWFHWLHHIQSYLAIEYRFLFPVLVRKCLKRFTLALCIEVTKHKCSNRAWLYTLYEKRFFSHSIFLWLAPPCFGKCRVTN